jgi:hypothetical protein
MVIGAKENDEALGTPWSTAAAAMWEVADEVCVAAEH